MTDAALSGFGVIKTPGLIPAANNTVVANISGSTGYPANTAIADVLAAFGTLSYQGTWNASTNSPALVSSTGTSGYYYVVSTAGTTSLNGIADWSVGDWVIFNGTAVVWQKIEGGATTVTVGSTAISSGTTTRILYDNAGTLGEYTITGTGTIVAMQAAPTFSGTLTAASAILTGTLSTMTIAETFTTPTISAGTLTISLAVGTVFNVANSANITTFTISNAPTARASAFTLFLTANGSGYTQSWGASVNWAGGTAPTLTTTSAKRDILTFVTNDGGTTWFGLVGGQNF